MTTGLFLHLLPLISRYIRFKLPLPHLLCDIDYLSRNFDFDGLKLQTAIQETLQNRGTAYEQDSFDRVISLAYEPEMQQKWRFFLRNLHGVEIEFADVMSGITAFLLPVWNAILAEKEFQKTWRAKNREWLNIMIKK